MQIGNKVQWAAKYRITSFDLNIKKKRNASKFSAMLISVGSQSTKRTTRRIFMTFENPWHTVLKLCVRSLYYASSAESLNFTVSRAAKLAERARAQSVRIASRVGQSRAITAFCIMLHTVCQQQHTCFIRST